MLNIDVTVRIRGPMGRMGYQTRGKGHRIWTTGGGANFMKVQDGNSQLISDGTKSSFSKHNPLRYRPQKLAS